MAAVISPKTQAARTVFGFISTSHPFYEQIIEFENVIQSSTAYSKLLSRQENGLATFIHAEIKTKVANGVRAIDRFYYSIQYPNAQTLGGLYAWSLNYVTKDGQLRAYEFPDDPKLSHLAAFIKAPENKDIKLLRYVPLRRVTFLKPGKTKQADLIGKLKKPNRAEEAYLRLADIASICTSSIVSIPRAESLDSAHAVFYQTLSPGEEITYLLTEDNYLDLLFEIGKLHGELGKLPLPKDKRWDRDSIPNNLQNDLAEIKFYLPDTAHFIDKVASWLDGQRNNIRPTNDIFCHGDFACSQILKHQEGWSVVDFDLAGIGNPYQDMAMFVASLGHDVPLFQVKPKLIMAAKLAYLDGYKDVSSEHIDPLTFAWHLVCAEVYYLALILKKDRFSQTIFQHAQERINELLKQDHDDLINEIRGAKTL
jgi:thiamine kinase-like enzyme